MSEATATKMVIWNCNLEGIEGISINMQIEDATGLVCGFSIDYENVEYTPNFFNGCRGDCKSTWKILWSGSTD